MDGRKLALGGALVLTLVALAGLLVLASQPMACDVSGCYRVTSAAVESALMSLVILGATASGWLAVAALRPSPFAFRCCLVAAASLAVLAFVWGAAQSSSCTVSSEVASCTQTIPPWASTLAFALVSALVAASVGALAARVLSAKPGTPERERGLRIAIGLFALCFLVPVLLSLRTPGAPDGVEWHLEGREMCARWTYMNGGGASCRPLSSLIVAPIAVVAGASAALQAGRPGWRWAGWAAVALGFACVGVIVVLNFGSTGKSDWRGTAALTAGLALACWHLQKERSRADPGTTT